MEAYSMRRRQIFSQKTREAERELLSIKPKAEEKKEEIENESQKQKKVICNICNKLFDTRGYNVHRRNCK